MKYYGVFREEVAEAGKPHDWMVFEVILACDDDADSGAEARRASDEPRAAAPTLHDRLEREKHAARGSARKVTGSSPSTSRLRDPNHHLSLLAAALLGPRPAPPSLVEALDVVLTQLLERSRTFMVTTSSTATSSRGTSWWRPVASS